VASALWWTHAQRWRPSALAGLVGTFLLVVALHATWDASKARYGYLVIGAISFVLLLRQTRRNLLKVP
jgi:hypothetical protein